ncbi:TetR/AcrR family transcriptional regulator, partial [Rathayibacter tritici]
MSGTTSITPTGSPELNVLRRNTVAPGTNGVRPRQQRGIETRERLLRAATVVMAEVGRDRLTICEVVKRAGVAAGTFYRYFPDRAVLIEAVLARDPVHQAQLEILNEAVL